MNTARTVCVKKTTANIDQTCTTNLGEVERIISMLAQIGSFIGTRTCQLIYRCLLVRTKDEIKKLDLARLLLPSIIILILGSVSFGLRNTFGCPVQICKYNAC
jgi:L-cystine uptake protein TcyP (sodium:dicarboxylate symporter family)